VTIAVLFLCCALVLASCSAVPAGTIRGELTTKTGEPSQNTGLQLLVTNSQDTANPSFTTTSYETKTDDKGKFAFEKVENGKYVILVQDFSFRLGGSVPSPEELIIRDKGNKIILIDLSGSKGIDLGALEFGE
jgi:hypothetical protein